MSLEQELYSYLSVSSSVFYTIIRLNLRVIANLSQKGNLKKAV